MFFFSQPQLSRVQYILAGHGSFFQVKERLGRRRRKRKGIKRVERRSLGSVSWVKIDGHQRPWAASRLEQGIAPPRRPRSGGVTAVPQVPSQRRCRPPGRAVIRTCRRCPCEAAPRCCVIVPRGDLRGIPYFRATA